jgi:hypothetical protein
LSTLGFFVSDLSVFPGIVDEKGRFFGSSRELGSILSLGEQKFGSDGLNDKGVGSRDKPPVRRRDKIRDSPRDEPLDAPRDEPPVRPRDKIRDAPRDELPVALRDEPLDAPRDELLG